MTTAADSASVYRSPAALLFAVGLVLRTAGLFVYGMEDMDEMLLDWGAAVHADGLIETFGINYGVLSYALFGPAYDAGELIPRFWWAPYKLMILGFDVGVLAALLRLTPMRGRTLVLLLFWCNPWFILHEAFQGFWEGPHVLFGLLAASWLATHARESTRPWAWVVVGALLGVSGMFKPQGLLYFGGPVGLVLLLLTFGRGAGAVLWAYVAGLMAVVTALSLSIWALGGSALALGTNFGTAFSVMPSVSNGGPGIWRFVTFVYMIATGQTGHVSAVRLEGPALALLSEIAAGVCLAIMIVFALRFRRASVRLPDWGALLLTMALASLVLAQFGVRAHLNHTYTATVLFVPLAATLPSFRRLWLALVSLLGVSHLLVYGFGRAILLPGGAADSYPAARPLVDQVASLPAYGGGDTILRVQAAANAVVTGGPTETIVSLLSPIVFVITCLMIRAVFREIQPALLHSAGGSAPALPDGGARKPA